MTKDLEELVHLIDSLRDKSMTNNWNLVRDKELKKIIKSVVEPAQQLKLSVGFALDVLHSYKGYKLDPPNDVPTWDHLTLIPLDPPQDSSCWPRFRTPLLVWHASLMSVVAPNERCRLLLGNALKQYQKNLVVRTDDLERAEYMEFPHLRDGFKLLAKRLREWNNWSKSDIDLI
jgi:hypothetical protein